MGEKTVVMPVQRLRYLDIINTLLTCGLLVLIMAVISLKFMGKNDNILNLKYSAEQTGIIPELKIFKKPLDYYEKILSRKDLFIGQPQVKNLKSKVTGANNGGQLSELELMGIVSGPQGPQAIINNSKTDRSFYCQGGENLGDFTVKKVYLDRVLLERDGEELELRL
ncbi:MAG: type II secretion system protein N [Candidatus Omnitrophota bacterium]